ncbi:MAG TPA: hypothetical protein VLH12_02710, partial [Usitatibacter sp.]|nr:hypothetical protein [Usitatibacter sp.]
MKPINQLPALLVAAVLGLASAAAIVAAPNTAYAQATGAAPAAAPATADAPKPAAATPAPPAGAGQDATTTKEVVENPYGLEALWKQGDFVSRGTLIILIIMSMGSWYIMFVKVYEQAKLFRQAREVQAKFWGASSVADGSSQLKDGTAYRYISEAGIKSTQHHEGKLL